MPIKTLTTTYEHSEFESFLVECVSKSVKTEISKLLESQKPEKNIYTRQETAELLGISLPTLNEYTKQGIITAHRLGYSVRYKLEDIERALVVVKTNKNNI